MSRWRHATLRSCKLPLGGGLRVYILEIDSEGFIESELNEYAERALSAWAEYIGFERVSVESAPDETATIGDAETTQTPKKPRRKRRAT